MSTPVRALFRRFPEAEARLPWVPLATLPTPVEPIAPSAAAGGARLWVKRDDRSGRPYGGNKVRKLEFLLARARNLGATRLITAGAIGSHHALATTLYGGALGFRTTLVLFPQPPTAHVRRMLHLDQALGAEIRWAPRMELVPAALLLACLAHRRERVCVIPPGGSDPVGTLGYVSAALELADQIEAGEAPAPATIHVAAGTLGTAAGLAIGLGLAGLEARIRAIRITSRLVTNRLALRRLVERTARLLHAAGIPAPPVASALARIELCHGQIGSGYGHETAAGRAALEVLGRQGLPLDPTYTAKAAADLLSTAEADGPRLFWSTLSATEPEVGSPDGG